MMTVEQILEVDMHLEMLLNYRGLTTVRKSIEVSSNVVNMKILSNVDNQQQ